MEETVYIYGGVKTSPVHLRNTAGTSGLILADIPQGEEAALLEYGDYWCRVRYGSRTGWVMTKFVHREADSPEETDTHGTPEDRVVLSRAALEAVYDQLGDLLGKRG